MESNSIFDSVSLTKIDWDDHRFQVTTSGPSGTLVDSIERVGVLTPPMLLKHGSYYTIISGFRRLKSCKRLGILNITAQIFSSKTPLVNCARMAITENLFIRELNLVEKGRIVQMLDQFYPDQSELCEEANGLGLPLNFEMARKLRAVSQMHAIVQNAVVEGHIALPVALQIDEMTDESTAIKIAQIFGEIGLGLNRQREFIDWLVGISRREHIAVEKLIEDRELNEILDDTETDRKQKSTLVRQYFKNRRYPEISKTAQRYQTFIKALRLGKGVQLIPPAHFEGQTYAIKIEFSNYEELTSRYNELEATIESSTLRPLWENFGLK